LVIRGTPPGMRIMNTMTSDRDQLEYQDALCAAEEAGEPWFSFADFMPRRQARLVASLEPTRVTEDDIQF
jgi:hypothetical protein